MKNILPLLLLVLVLLSVQTVNAAWYNNTIPIYQFEVSGSQNRDSNFFLNATLSGTIANTTGIVGGSALTCTPASSACGFNISESGHINPTTSQTIGLWVNISSNSSYIYSKGSVLQYYMFVGANGTLEYTWNVGGTSQANGQVMLADSNNHCVIATFNGTHEYLVIDNVTDQASIKVRTGTITINALQPLSFFSRVGSSPLKGVIDQVFFANRTLNPVEISQFCSKVSFGATVATLNVTVQDVVQNVPINNFCISAPGMVASSTCTSAGSIELANIGTVTVNAYSIGVGDNLTQTFFNATQSSLSFSASTFLKFNTSEALVNMTGVYQLYTNNSISSYNMTNNKTSSNFSNLINASMGPNNIRVDIGGNYSVNVSCTITTPLSIGTCNTTGVYDSRYTIGAKDIGGNSVSTFNISLYNTVLGGLLYNQGTTNHSLVISVLQGYNYTFALQAASYAYQNLTAPANASTHLYNFTLQGANSLNLTFYDEVNGSSMNGTVITVNLISSALSLNRTTSNGSLYLTNLSPGSYVIRYSATGYSLKLYQFVLTNNTYTAISLPMLLSSLATAVTVTVVDLGGRTQSNVTVRVLRYNVVTNTYSIVEIFNTNNDGVGQFDATLNSEFYYFIVQSSDGTVLLQTTPSLLYSNTLQLTVGNAVEGLENLFNEVNIIGTITYNTTSDIARFTYTDSDNTASQGCLYTYRITYSDKTLYNSSCVSSASSTLTSPITNTSGSYWLFQGVVTKGGVDYLVSTLNKSFADILAQESRNKVGLFMLLIIELLVIAIFSYSIRLMVIVGTAMPMLFSIFAFIPLGLGYTAPLFIIGIVIAYILGT